MKLPVFVVPLSTHVTCTSALVIAFTVQGSNDTVSPFDFTHLLLIVPDCNSTYPRFTLYDANKNGGIHLNSKKYVQPVKKQQQPCPNEEDGRQTNSVWLWLAECCF